MERAVVQSYLCVNDRIAGYNTRQHCALNALVDGRNKFLRYNAAGNGIDKLIAFALVRLDCNLNVAVLPVSARLPCVLGFSL